MRLPVLFIIFIIAGSTANSAAQTSNTIPVVDFAQFEPLLHKSGDTVYIINFWATWCVPCRKELPEFQKFYQEHPDQNISLLLVSLDFPDQVGSNLVPFLEKNGITAPVILLNDPNSNAWIDKVHPSWSGSLPATLIYKNETRSFFEEELTYDSLLEATHKLNN